MIEWTREHPGPAPSSRGLARTLAAGHLLAGVSLPCHRGTLGGSEPLPFLFWFTEGRKRKENSAEVLGTKQAVKETVSGEPQPSRLCSRQLRKACRLKKKPQLALVWFSARPCLFKFVLGALWGQPTFNCAHMGFLEPAPGAANTHTRPVFFPLKREILEPAEDPAARSLGSKPRTRQPLWEQHPFPASPGLKDFLGKLTFAGASMREGPEVGVIS